MTSTPAAAQGIKFGPTFATFSSDPRTPKFEADGAPRLRPPKRPIALRHLLTHTAGFTYADTSYRANLVGNSSGVPLDPALRKLPVHGARQDVLAHLAAEDVGEHGVVDLAPLITARVPLERFEEAFALLESIASDRSVLEGVPAEDRQRLLQAVAFVYSPDRSERRRMAKAAARDRKAGRVKQDEVTRADAA